MAGSARHTCNSLVNHEKPLQGRCAHRPYGNFLSRVGCALRTFNMHRRDACATKFTLTFPCCVFNPALLLDRGARPEELQILAVACLLQVF
jgi:hypothetical protein